MKRLSILAGSVALGVVVALPTAAMAHSDVESSDPPADGTVQTMPTSVSVTFGEMIGATAKIAVTSADGIRVNSYDVAVKGDTVSSAIIQPTAAGPYTLTYTVDAADGDAVTGTIRFRVRQASAPVATASPTQPGATPSPGASPSAGDPQGQVAIPTGDDDSMGVKDALIITGFTIIAMFFLIRLVGAGLRSATAEDDD